MVQRHFANSYTFSVFRFNRAGLLVEEDLRELAYNGAEFDLHITQSQFMH